MSELQHWTRGAWVGAGYFGLAAVSLLAVRFDNGLAYLWFASPLLIAVLSQLPRHNWRGPLLWSAGGSFLATGLFGLGWEMAPLLALANMAEAVVAAYLLRRARSSLMTFASVRWTGNLLWTAGIAGPAVMATIAMVPLWLQSGQPPASTVLRVIIGHGLPNLTFIPMIKLYLTGRSGPWHERTAVGVKRPIALLLALQALLTILVFAQNALVLLFLPILPVVAMVFRGDSQRSALSLILLSVIACGFTLAGRGPASLLAANPGEQMQLLQLYLFATAFTIVPIAAQMRVRGLLVRRVAHSEARYRMLSDHSSDIIAHSDAEGRLLFASPSIRRFGGKVAKAMEGSSIFDLVDPRDNALVRERFAAVIMAGGDAVRFVYRTLTPDGQSRWLECVCRGVSGPEGEVQTLVSIIRDISDRKNREDELENAALTDPLTGTANRRALQEAVGVLIRRPTFTGSIALLDIDHFKVVNDRHGHAAGDQALKRFAIIARGLLRDCDILARVGGEEFAILFPGIAKDDAAKVCERIGRTVAQAVMKSPSGPIRMTVSGGVADLRNDGLDAALKRADNALYESKSKGRDRMSLAA